MELFFDCIPCLMKQALEAARAVTDDVEMHDEVLSETIQLLTDYKKFRNSPDLAREIHKIVKRATGQEDPYLNIKTKDLLAAKSVYSYLKDFMKKKENDLLTQRK